METLYIVQSQINGPEYFMRPLYLCNKRAVWLHLRCGTVWKMWSLEGKNVCKEALGFAATEIYWGVRSQLSEFKGDTYLKK